MLFCCYLIHNCVLLSRAYVNVCIGRSVNKFPYYPQDPYPLTQLIKLDQNIAGVYHFFLPVLHANRVVLSW